MHDSTTGLEAENHLLRATLEAIQDRIEDLLDDDDESVEQGDEDQDTYEEDAVW